MFAARAGFFNNTASGPVVNFPLGSIVPYYGTNVPALADWSLYTNGSSGSTVTTTPLTYISATTNPTKLQTFSSLAYSGNPDGARLASVNPSVGGITTGAHTGTSSFTSGAWKLGSSNLNNVSNLTAGGHYHTGGGTYDVSLYFPVNPSKATVRLLRANKATPTIPAGTIAFRNPATGTYGTRLYANNKATYLINGTTGGSMSNPEGTYTASRNTGSAGTHQHNGNNYLFYASTPNTYPTALSAGSHSHLMTASMYQDLMRDTLVLSAWQSLAERVPATDVIVMYNGLISDLTGTGWYLCNGTNGTLNINEVFVGLSQDNSWGLSWGTLSPSNARFNSITMDNGTSATHGHNTGTTGGAGVGAYHPSQSWAHTHPVTTTSGLLDYIGRKYYLYFIQYKG